MRQFWSSGTGKRLKKREEVILEKLAFDINKLGTSKLVLANQITGSSGRLWVTLLCYKLQFRGSFRPILARPGNWANGFLCYFMNSRKSTKICGIFGNAKIFAAKVVDWVASTRQCHILTKIALLPTRWHTIKSRCSITPIDFWDVRSLAIDLLKWGPLWERICNIQNLIKFDQFIKEVIAQ